MVVRWYIYIYNAEAAAIGGSGMLIRELLSAERTPESRQLGAFCGASVGTATLQYAPHIVYSSYGPRASENLYCAIAICE